MKSFHFHPSVVLAAVFLFMRLAVHADVTGFGDNGAGWTVKSNGTGNPVISADRLVITQNGVGGSARAAWFNTPQDIGSNWTARFTSRITSAIFNDHADGFAFVLHNSASGTNAIGPGGGSVGYFESGGTPGIENSVAVAFQDYIGNGTVNSNNVVLGAGGIAQQTQTPSSIQFFRINDPINVAVHYVAAEHKIVVLLRQHGVTESFVFNNVSLGGTATAGFTGGTGASTQTQEISDFSFTHGENAPIASADRVALNSSVVEIHPLENDYDDNADSGDFLRITNIGTPRFGQATIADAGMIYYAANTNFPGIDYFDYTCTDTTGLSATARVTIVNGTLPGTYRGQFTIGAGVDPNSAVSATVTVAATRAFTAQFQWEGKRATIKGILPVAGGYNHNYPLPDHTVAISAGQPMGTVDLSFQAGSNQFGITAQVDMPPPRTGALTAALDPPINTPGYGRGYLTGKVSSNGAARFVGKLADGQPVTIATGMNVYLEMPLFAMPYRGGQSKGIVQGTFLGNTARPYVHIRAAGLPGGYSNGFGIQGTAAAFDYIAPKKTENPFTLGTTPVPLTFTYLADGFLVTGAQNVQVNPGGSVQAIAPVQFKKTAIKINKATGMFSGSFNDPNGPAGPRSFSGVLLQNNLGVGQYPAGGSQGAVLLVP